MTTWIVLLRGINVGGRHIVPMADLRGLLEGLGCKDVRTYIQSGNCVFDSEETDGAGLAAAISQAIGRRFGFEPQVLAMTKEAFAGTIADNPFAAASPNPSHVHFFFFFEPPQGADLDGLRALARPGEVFAMTESVFYLHAPEGIGRSELVQRIGKYLPVSMTARNLRTVTRLADLAS